MPNQVVWCDIPCVDLDRALAFYSAVLGQTVPKDTFGDMSFGVLPHQGNDNGGCLVVLPHMKPSADGPMLYFNCDGRLDAAVEAVTKHGGKVVQPAHAIGPHGFRAIVLDSEGNRIALHSH